MLKLIPFDRLRFFLNRLQERLWVKPLGACLLSVLSISIASFIDGSAFAQDFPEVSLSSVEALLQVLTGGMLVIATFAVGAMVSAYGSASRTATPRSFSVVVSDDISQNALSVFTASFIFSIVGLAALKNGLLDGPGRTVLFGLTLYNYGLVIYSFVRWVDSIARLGRLGNTIAKVEEATQLSFDRRCCHPNLKARHLDPDDTGGTPVFSDKVGHLQRVDIQVLQGIAEEHQLTISVMALPGHYASPHVALAKVQPEKGEDTKDLFDKIRQAFQIGKDRIFDEDPRFGLIVLSEIAGKALSPAVNDPGTAIDVMGSLHRLLNEWGQHPAQPEEEVPYDRVRVPQISVQNLFEDAFTSLSRDGAANLEVGLRLQTTLAALSRLDHPDFQKAAKSQAEQALARAEQQISYPPDFEKIQQSYHTLF